MKVVQKEKAGQLPGELKRNGCRDRPRRAQEVAAKWLAWARSILSGREPQRG